MATNYAKQGLTEGTVRAMKCARRLTNLHRPIRANAPGLIEIIGILIATGDSQYPGSQDVGQTMDDAALVTGIGNAADQVRGDADRTLRLRQRQRAAIRRQPPVIERLGHFLAAKRWESKTGNAILGHGERGTFCPGSEGRLSNHSLHQIGRLSHARHPGMIRPMNKSG